MEYDFIDNPIKAYKYENKIITSNIGYKNLGKISDAKKIAKTILYFLH